MNKNLGSACSVTLWTFVWISGLWLLFLYKTWLSSQNSEFFAVLTKHTVYIFNSLTLTNKFNTFIDYLTILDAMAK